MNPIAAEVLKAAGYLSQDAQPADGLVMPGYERATPGEAARLGPLLANDPRGLSADAVFRVGTSPVILFKSGESSDHAEQDWHRLAWNFGFAPLLWVTTPHYVRLYNAYQPPEDYGGSSPLLEEIPLGVSFRSALDRVEALCGRRHVAMGAFWRSTLARKIDRRTRVDNVLLEELGLLLKALVQRGLRPSLAQKLVGRCVFFQYLVHREYLAPDELASRFGAPTLHELLKDVDRTYALFRWIRTTFNGDLFPIEDEASEKAQVGQGATSLEPLSDFFGHFSVQDGQGRLFPFRFDAIPVELISSIYEKFVHISDTDGTPRRGVHYTPINLVDLILDPAFEGLSSTARILDPACGSGVFLVEALRRLVWMRGRDEHVTRELIRDVLYSQIRGVDISPAALSVAAFSLYLALLELDPSAPRGLDDAEWLRFEPLDRRVLFATSTFNPELDALLAGPGPSRFGGGAKFDLIVGNPPWTYSSDEKKADKTLARGPDHSSTNGDTDVSFVDEPQQRLGTTYARLKRRPIPARSMDWPFLWRTLDFSGPDTRVALVMKATPFFSLDAATRNARDQVFQTFANVNIVNLSQLRTAGLFQEYEDDDGEGRSSKRAAGPALLFMSNCLPTTEGSVATVNFPWSSTFERTGVFELPADPPVSVPIDALRRTPGILKASLFGTERDVWFVERLSTNRKLIRLDEWVRSLKLPIGQGYQRGDTMPAAHLIGLPKVTARDFKKARLKSDLSIFSDQFVHRSREASIFTGPLVLLPEGSLTNAPSVGRYTAAFDRRSLAYNESFIGISFYNKSEVLARSVAAIMHSSLVAYQLGLTGGTVGIKQTKIEAVDLENIFIPQVEQLPEEQLKELAQLESALSRTEADAERALKRIDEIVAEVTGFTDADVALLEDVDRRTRAIFFETDAARSSMERSPSDAELESYASAVCRAFNAFATTPDDVSLVPDRYSRLDDDIVVVGLRLEDGAPKDWPAARHVDVRELHRELWSELGGTELPYLKPAKSLRLYVDRHIYMMKTPQYRYFSPAAGLSDGDRIVSDVMSPGFAGSEPRLV